MATTSPRYHWIRCGACACSHTSALDVALCHVERGMVDAPALVAAVGTLAVARDIVRQGDEDAERAERAAEYA